MRVLGIGLALTAVLGLAGMAQAEPLNLKQVPADAKWLVHVDVDAMRTSTVVHKAFEKCMAMCQDAEKHLNKVRDATGMDPRKDLHGATFYGKQVGKHRGVAIVHAKADPRLLLKKAEQAPDHKVTEYGSFKLHSWTRKARGHTHTATGTIYKPDCLVFASSIEELKNALDVLEGKSASVGSDSPLADAATPAGTILAIRATGLAGVELPCKSPVVKQMESVRAVIGENDGRSFLQAKAVTTTPEVAGQVKTVIEGVRAMGILHSLGDEKAQKMANVS